MTRTTGLGILMLLLVVACGSSTGGNSLEATDSDRGVAEGDGRQLASTVSALSASTVGNSDSTAPAATEASGQSATSEPATTEASGRSATSEPATTGVVFEPGPTGTFTSPSGNIACLMTVDYGASCWISEKQWTIDQPTEPGCEEFDYGNAVDVTGSGVVFPCYSDFSWDPSAPPLEYGNRMQVGDFECVSRSEGVTCFNPAGQGFRLARAEVVLL